LKNLGELEGRAGAPDDGHSERGDALMLPSKNRD
jgi:hypothetical protein